MMYLIQAEHYMSRKEGILTMVIHAATPAAAMVYFREQLKHPDVWVNVKIKATGVDTHA